MTACPCCGKPWTAPDRIALMFGRVAISEHGVVTLNRRQAEALACVIAAPMARAEFRAAFAGGDAKVVNDFVSQLNGRLKPLRWRLRLIGLSDAREVYAATEILRSENGRLRGGPSPRD